MNLKSQVLKKKHNHFLNLYMKIENIKKIKHLKEYKKYNLIIF